jgi:hypothetical protein
LDSNTVLKLFLKENLLPKILTSAAKPKEEDLLKNTVLCQHIYETVKEGIEKDMEFWILTKEGGIRTTREVLFSKEFKPEQDWETHQKYVPGVSFSSPRYIENSTSDDDLKTWLEFFKSGGVKEAPVNGIEVYAENCTDEKLKERGYENIIHVDKMRFGYDIQAESPKGEKVFIEVKGQSYDQEAELTGGETEAADTYKEDFYLCVVSPIPENPSMYMVQSPAAPGVGKKDKITIPVNVWKSARVS